MSQRLLTIEDILALQSVGECDISPDGRWIVYDVVRTSRTGKFPESSIWLADTLTDAPPRRITFGPHHDSSPNWSPDGRCVAFLSDRALPDIRQIYLLSPDFGDAIGITNFDEGVLTFSWSPDGSQIGCIVKEEPEASPQQAGPGEADQREFDADNRAQRLYIVQATAYEHDVRPSPVHIDRLHVISFDWSPDSSAVVIAGTHEPRIDDAFRRVQIMHIPLDGGDPLPLAISAGTNVTPRWSPDGHWIAYRSGEGASYLSTTLRIVPATGGESTCLTCDSEGHVFGFRWLPDSRGIAVVTQHGLYSRVQRVDVASRAIETLSSEPFSAGGIDQTSFSLSREGAFALVREYDHEPRAVWKGVKGAPMRRISSVPAVLAEIHLGEVLEVAWKASNGTSLSGALVTPPEYEAGTPVPLVVQIHGGPAGVCQRRFQVAWNEWAQILAAHGIAVFRPNPRGSSGYGNAFVAANKGDWGDGPLDDIARGIDALIEQGIVDPDRLGVGGWSYGGYLTAWAITHSDRFKCAVIGAPVVNLLSFSGTTDIPTGFLPTYYYGDPYSTPAIYHAQSPLYYVDNVQAPVLLLHGENDVRVPLTQSIELYTALRARRKTVQFVTYPREDHGFVEPAHQRDVLERVVGWFRRYLV
jgi:dipeptidyl aminopeptidase/acylaminoacyl peptidase